MEGKLFESRIGRLIACICFNVMVCLPLIIELISSKFDLSAANGFMYIFALLASCFTTLHYIGNMTDIRILSSLLRNLHAIILYGATLIIIISHLVPSSGSGEQIVSAGLNSAKEVGYFGFLYITNTFLNGINRYNQTKYLLDYQNARWILLFAASVLVIPVSIAFQSLLNYEIAATLCLFFIVIYFLYASTNSAEAISFIGFWGSFVITLTAIIISIVMYANGVCVLLNGCLISFSALTIAYYISHFILGIKRERETTSVGENEIAICFIFPAAVFVAGVGLGFLSLINLWVIAISVPVSMLILYIVVKCVLYPKESKKEKSRRGTSDLGPLDLLPGYTNRDVIDKICSRISYADMVCSSYSYEFLAHARAEISNVSGNTYTVRVYYHLNFHPEGRSTPNSTEDSQLKSDAYRQVKDYFKKYQNYLKNPCYIEFRY